MGTRFHTNFLIYFLLLNSVYTVLPLVGVYIGAKGGTIQMKTVKYVHGIVG